MLVARPSDTQNDDIRFVRVVTVEGACLKTTNAILLYRICWLRHNNLQHFSIVTCTRRRIRADRAPAFSPSMSRQHGRRSMSSGCDKLPARSEQGIEQGEVQRVNRRKTFHGAAARHPRGSRVMSDDLFLVSPRCGLAAAHRRAREQPASSHADIRPSSFAALLSRVGVITILELSRCEHALLSYPRKLDTRPYDLTEFRFSFMTTLASSTLSNGCQGPFQNCFQITSPQGFNTLTTNCTSNVLRTNLCQCNAV